MKTYGHNADNRHNNKSAFLGLLPERLTIKVEMQRID